jgi:ABC-type uncharacterized transport system permease subunit
MTLSQQDDENYLRFFYLYVPVFFLFDLPATMTQYLLNHFVLCMQNLIAILFLSMSRKISE